MMTTTLNQDPLVCVECIALAGNHSRRRTSQLPPHDGYIPRGDTKPAKGWRLSTLHAWNPAVAERCAAIHTALVDLPSPVKDAA